jgi:DNA-binding beta-propeller fold protein YncE
MSAVALKGLGWQISQFNNPGVVTLNQVWQGALVLGILFVLSIGAGWFWLRSRWLIAGGIFWAMELLFFTTFLTNGQGIGTGLIGSVGYWIEQQEVMRGGQPWYYFYLLVPLYEFLPLLLGLGGMSAWVASLWRAGNKETRKQGDSAVESPASVETPKRSEAAARRSKAGDKPAAVPARQPALGSAITPPFGVQRIFEAFLVFWMLGTWAVFTYVGEKMAWHTVYFATTLAPLGGWWLGRVIDGLDWRRARERGVFWLMGMVPLVLLTLKALLPTSTRRPFVDVTVSGLSNSAQWLLALVVGLALVYFLYDRIAALGAGQSLRAVAVSLTALLAVFTFGVAYRFAFINYDYATEPMVYAHATPDVKLLMGQVEEISRKTAGGNALKVAYDDDSTWPLEWYLRDYPKKAYFGASPSREAVDAPVVIAGDKNLSKVKPYLGDRYYEFNYRLIWWPRETYKGLSWQRIREGLLDPKQRGQFWDAVIHRRYTTPTAQWDPIHRFSLFVRKDVAAQVWDWGLPAAAVDAQTGQPIKDPYEGGQRTLAAIQQIGRPLQPGSAAGQFNFPRAVTVGADGKVYVADSGNHRIQVFNADGTFVRQWGTLCKLIENRQGCQPAPAGSAAGDGQGQFNEPWGIAVDRNGNVYVSDTWNHRIQKFGPDGKFITAWGVFESTGGELGKPAAFYGPRALAIGQDNNLYAMDTGNKRVQVFRFDGSFVAQYGGGGLIEGRFDEPAGLDQDAAGNWYVADTWNRRIQKFDAGFKYLAQWPINGWASQSVVNKPQVAVDRARNIVYVTDPENYRVIAFNADGSFRATFGQYGNDAQSFVLPTGIAVGPDGKVYVADGDAHRIMVFAALQ